MKTTLYLLLAGFFVAMGAFSIYRRTPTHKTTSGAANRATATRPLAARPATRLAQAPEAGHVAEVLVWTPNVRVAKGQPLARLRIPVSTPALQLAQRALRTAEAALAHRPTAGQARQVALARARFAAVPRYERDGYALAPVAGRLARSLVSTGQYLARTAAVAVIEETAPTPGTVAVR